MVNPADDDAVTYLLDIVSGLCRAETCLTIRPQPIDIASLQDLRITSQRKNPTDIPMDETLFVNVCGEFLEGGSHSNTKDVFRAMDVLNEGEIGMKFFLLAYQLLCEVSSSYRTSLLYFGAKIVGEDMLDSTAMTRILLFLNISANSVDRSIELLSGADIGPVTNHVLESFISERDVGHPIGDVRVSPPVDMWLDTLNRFSVQHEDGDRRNVVERQLILLEMERFKVADNVDPPPVAVADSGPGSSPGDEEDSVPTSPQYASTPRRGNSERVHGPVLRLPKPATKVIDTPFSIDYSTIKWKQEIGRGAHAAVWKAEWLHMPVAVKVLEGEIVMDGEDTLSPNDDGTENGTVDETTKQDFLREIEVLSQLRHPNVLLCMGACVSTGKPLCIVTELYHGGSVHELIHGSTERRLTPREFFDISIAVARGMLYLHSSTPTILHRDLKSSNILCDKHVSHCVISDFGLSKFVGLAGGGMSVHSKANQGDAGGTPYTMAPEVMDGEPYTKAADVYSFGIIMWEMWTGKIPFEGMQPIQLMFKVYAEGARPPITLEDRMHPRIEQLITDCWSELPTSRPTFENILDELEDEALRQAVAELEPPPTPDPFEAAAEMMIAIQNGQVERVQELLDAGCNVNFTDYDHRTPLHLAAAEKKPELVRLLIGHGADVHARDRWGATPLYDAHHSNCSEIVDMLTDAGAEQDVPSLHSNVSMSPGVHTLPQGDIEFMSLDLMRAIFQRDKERVSLLLAQGADPKFCDYDNRTPLHLAASEGATEIGSLLCQRGVDLDARDRWGSTPLMDAQRSGHAEMQLILEVAKSKQNLALRGS